MVIKEISETHLKACSKIYIETFNSEPWNDKWDEATACRRLDDIFNTPRFVGFGAFDGDGLIGAVLGNLEQWYEGNMYNLKEMFVKKGENGKGIGSHLIAELEKSIVEMGTHSVCLMTSNGGLAEKFYLKNNYSVVEEMVMMGKDLT